MATLHITQHVCIFDTDLCSCTVMKLRPLLFWIFSLVLWIVCLATGISFAFCGYRVNGRSDNPLCLHNVDTVRWF